MNQLYPLTQPQKRIWITQNIYPTSPMYNIGGTVMLQGSVDTHLLQSAIQEYIISQSAFSIRITYQDQVPMQYFCTDKPIVEYIDFSTCVHAEKEYSLWELRQAQTYLPILESQLYKFFVFKLSDVLFGYFIMAHHLITDGWSMQLITNGIYHNYTFEKAGQYEGQDRIYSYQSFFQDEKEYLQSVHYNKSKRFLMDLFEGSCISFGAHYQHLDGTRRNFPLTKWRSVQIREFCIQNNVSVSCLFLSLYILHVYQSTEKEDLLIGIPVLGRQKRHREIVGMFVNTMLIPYHIQEQLSFLELLHSVNTTLVRSYSHQRYPYNHLVNELYQYKTPNIDIFINYYGTTMVDTYGDVIARNKEFYNGQQAYPLQIIIREWAGEQVMQLDFDSQNELYCEEDIQVMYQSMMMYLDSVLDKPYAILNTSAHREALHEGNAIIDMNEDITVTAMFEKQAALTPLRTAVEYDGNSYTYSDLYKRAGQICKLIADYAVEPSSVIGVVTSHSYDTLAAIWGILLYGCVFMPIDPQTPVFRIEYMLQDSNVSLLLTETDMVRDLKWDGVISRLDEADVKISEEWRIQADLDTPAYIMYTSGSTGLPKGVLVSHRNLATYTRWAKTQYIKGLETFALFTSLAFDLTITSIFLPFVSGSKVVIYPQREDEYVLFRILEENRCTVIKLTPSHLQIIRDRKMPYSRIKRLIVGGEQLRTDIARQIQGNFGMQLEIINEYGPTEATVGCMIHRFDINNCVTDAVPIGEAICKTHIFILDQFMKPVPIGVTGKLYIEGDSVTSGYINKPELTSQAFLQYEDNGLCRRIYCTGDMAKYISDDCAVYCGRDDTQIKIRGHRVDLREIEIVLEKFSGVSSVCVKQIETRNQGYLLCAYYFGSKEVSESELSNFASCHLPAYMKPDVFYYMSWFPITINGKLDVKSLPTPDNVTPFSLSSQKIDGHPFWQICAEILSLKQVSPADNFYHLGGDSIKAIQISSKLFERGYLISIKDILENPIFSNMVQCISNKQEKETDSNLCSGIVQLTPILYWYLTNVTQCPHSYCQTAAIFFSRPVSIVNLEQTMLKVIQHHDMLRANMSTDNTLFYNPNGEVVPIEELSYEAMSDEMLQEEIYKQQSRLAFQMNIYHGLLIRTCLLRTKNGSVWCIVAHHLVMDGISWGILFEDLHTVLNQILSGENIVLPPKTASYQQWGQANSHDEEIVISNKVASKRLNKENVCMYAIKTIDQETVKRLLGKANNRYSTKPSELLLAGLLCTLYDSFGNERWRLIMEGHGRDCDHNLNVSRTIGWFTTLAGRFVDDFPDALEDRIIWSKEISRSMSAKGKWQDVISAGNTGEYKSIRFNYLGKQSAAYDLFEVKPTFPLCNELTETVEFDSLLFQGKLMMCLRLNESVTWANNANNLTMCLIHNINNILNHCGAIDEVRSTPSDFPEAGLSQQELDLLFS